MPRHFYNNLPLAAFFKSVNLLVDLCIVFFYIYMLFDNLSFRQLSPTWGWARHLSFSICLN